MNQIKITTPEGVSHIVPESNKSFYENRNLTLKKEGKALYKIEPVDPSELEAATKQTKSLSELVAELDAIKAANTDLEAAKAEIQAKLDASNTELTNVKAELGAAKVDADKAKVNYETAIKAANTDLEAAKADLKKQLEVKKAAK